MTDYSIPKAVPSAVAPSTGNSVQINDEPNREPRVTAQGGTRNPVVPKTETEGTPDPQPGYGHPGTTGNIPLSGDTGAPSLPDMNGLLFRKGPADPHYTSTIQGNENPYDKVNNPAVQGRYSWIKTLVNGIGLGTQNKDEAGWNVRSPQQRSSVMRMLMPQHGPGYAPETYIPKQLPQSPRWNKLDTPVIGSDSYGSGVLNADTFGAGQTAGGIGGNRYSPAPGPPDTTSTADQPANPSGMPMWG